MMSMLKCDQSELVAVRGCVYISDRRLVATVDSDSINTGVLSSPVSFELELDDSVYGV